MGMKFKPQPARMNDFTLAGPSGGPFVPSGTFPNAAGRGQRTQSYWDLVEADLARQRREAQKRGGKREKTSSRKQTPVKVTLTR